MASPSAALSAHEAEQAGSGSVETCPSSVDFPLEHIWHAIEAINEAAYFWNLVDDTLVWSKNVEKVLGCPAEHVDSGRAYAALLDSDNFTSRYDTVMSPKISDEHCKSSAFQIEYLFRPKGRHDKAAFWVEDHGRWFADVGGRPSHVYGTIRRIDKRHQRDQHLMLVGNDPLTGMMNRGRLSEVLTESIAISGRDNASCSMAIIVINNLSVVNEAYGFEIADEVIINVGKRLQQVIRSGDSIARYSGSKFAIIINNCNKNDLQVATERFLSVVRERVIETKQGPVWAMLSIGALVLPQQTDSANIAMAHAEEALTEARKLPYDGVVIYQASSDLSRTRSRNAQCAAQIVDNLKENRFKLAYQPIVDAKTHTPCYYEALLRMEDTSGDIVTAGYLIPLAEKLGLVRLIDRTVARMVLDALYLYPDAKISFNVSGTTATDPRWFGYLLDMLSEHRDVSGRLIVEITETVALGDLKETVRFVTALHELGCQVAIDDFGAGFTSFRNIKDLPIDILKLDGSFCHKLKENLHNQYFVRSLIDMARNFKLKTVAEWVEYEEDADFLRELEIDYFQGHLFGAAEITPPWQAAKIPEILIAPTQTDLFASVEQPLIESMQSPKTGEEPAMHGPPNPEIIATHHEQPEDQPPVLLEHDLKSVKQVSVGGTKDTNLTGNRLSDQSCDKPNELEHDPEDQKTQEEETEDFLDFSRLREAIDTLNRTFHAMQTNQQKTNAPEEKDTVQKSRTG